MTKYVGTASILCWLVYSNVSLALTTVYQDGTKCFNIGAQTYCDLTCGERVTYEEYQTRLANNNVCPASGGGGTGDGGTTQPLETQPILSGIERPSFSAAEIYFGDFNGDGLVDLYFATKKIIIIPFDVIIPVVIPGDPIVVQSTTNGTATDYLTLFDVAAPTVTGSSLNVYKPTIADFNGDGIQDYLFVSSEPGANNILMLGRSDFPYIDYVQTVSIPSVGYDVGGVGTSLSAQDLNGDGRSDLLIQRDGSYVGYLVANADGTLSRPESATEGKKTVEFVWYAFRAALNAGNSNAALQFVSREARGTYGRVFADLGPAAAGAVLNGVAAFTPINVSERLATYAITRDLNGQKRVNIVTFFKDSKDVWRIESL